MAEAAVTFLFEKTSELLTQEAHLLLEVEDQVRSLQDELGLIRAYLKDADAKSREKNIIKIWLTRLRDIAYDAEDVIDNYIECINQLKIQRMQLTSAGFMGVIWSSFECFNRLKIRHNTARSIDGIKRRLQELDTQRSQLGLEKMRNEASPHKEKIPPIVEEVDVVGFDADVKILVKELTEGVQQRSVLSIVGTGGLGKTTLAKKVYNHSDVKKQFDCHAWVYVSQDFRLKEILQEIIRRTKSLTRDEIKILEKMTVGEVKDKVREQLQEKRYLIVLDDVWQKEVCKDLVDAFPVGTMRSRVLLTTRNKDVALHAGAQGRSLHELKFLNNDESWNLFCKKAFPRDDSHRCPSHLESYGREIVAKCGGLPLAIVVLGGLLSTKGNLLHKWVKVWKVQDDNISRILALSYYDLPYDLKSCFQYIGAFPEDSEIRASTLIKLWVAEGIVKRRGEEFLEDAAENCLNELVSRSMIQVAKMSSYGGIKRCRIHDLLRDLAISKAKEERFLEVYDPTSPINVRRLAINNGTIDDCINTLHRTSKHLRSLLCLPPNEDAFGYSYGHLFNNGCSFKFLRVLELFQIEFHSNAIDEIGSLTHLRYLRMRDCVLSELPSTISNLYNLQTLDIRENEITIRKLEDGIWKLQQLRHLYLGGRRGWNEYNIIPAHVQLDHLINLRTLVGVRAGEWMEHGLSKFSNLNKLNMEGDDLSSYSHVFSTVKFACLKLSGKRLPALSSFSHNQNLHTLDLSGCLENLRGPNHCAPNLTKLILYETHLEQDPLATLEMLPNLRILTLCLDSYVGKEMVCSATGFPQLQTLKVHGLSYLQEWIVGEGAMPNLRHLNIMYCDKLKMLPQGLQHVTGLRELTIGHMSEEFKSRFEEDRYRFFQHVPSINIIW